MRDLTRFTTFRSAGLGLRPLLYAVGAAATTAGVYYMIKKFGDGHTNTLLNPGSVCDAEEVTATPTEPEVVRQIQTHPCVFVPPTQYSKSADSFLHTLVSLAEAKNKWADMSRSTSVLEESKTSQTYELGYMERVKQNFVKHLCDIRNNTAVALCENDKRKMMKRVGSPVDCLNQAIKILHDVDAKAFATLKMQYMQVKEQTDELLKQAMESNTRLEKENLDLMYHVKKMEQRVQQLEKLLYEADLACVEMKQERERAGKAYSILKLKSEEALKQRDRFPLDVTDLGSEKLVDF